MSTSLTRARRKDAKALHADRQIKHIRIGIWQYRRHRLKRSIQKDRMDNEAPISSRLLLQGKQVYDSVVDGVALADAMALHPETFPRVYVAMVEAGETGGFLDVVLAQIAEFQARDKELRSKVMSAMFYPIILFFFAILVVALLMVFFIPRFQKIFAGFGGATSVDNPDHHRRQPCDPFLRFVHPGRAGGVWLRGLELDQVRKRAAHLGKIDPAVADYWVRWWANSPWPVFAGCWAR